jgi:iduronate 2-sulfatase
MYDVNAVGCTWGCGPESPYGCAVDADIDGVPGPGVPPLADKVSTDDAVAKLTAAAAARVAGGPPFAIFAGIRKPHTPFRFPAPYAALYPPPANITLAKYKTFDASIPPIAYHPSGLWGEPYTAMPDADAQLARQGYYAAVSWMDHLVGRLLTALDASGLANDTVVAIHGDHGYSLGESSIWEKFTNFEQGVRVPLIVRAPWLGAGSVADLVELVDLYPTMAALAGVPLPPGEVFDGQSLVPLMSAAALHTAPPPEAVRGYALSVYPRCPKDTVNASMMWRANDCMEVERSAFFSMGVSLRTEDYRYTEWTLWDGNALAPRFDQPPIGVELYIHTDVDSNDFDSPAEVFNHADDPAYATVRAQLAAQLRVVYAARGA